MADQEKTSIINKMDTLFQRLLEECTAAVVVGDGQPDAPSFADRLALFKAGASWVAARNRVDIDDEPDDFAIKAARLRSGARRGRARPAETPIGDAAHAVPGSTNGAGASAAGSSTEG